MSALPYINIYVGDWWKDAIGGCSVEARGLWFSMMLMMHETDRYGFMSQNGKPIPDALIARKCGCSSVEQYLSILAELESAGVPSRTDDGIIYSRRMVRDAEKRAQEAERKQRERGQQQDKRRTNRGQTADKPRTTTGQTTDNDRTDPLCPENVRPMSAPCPQDVRSLSSPNSLSLSLSDKDININKHAGAKSRLPATKEEAVRLAGVIPVSQEFILTVFDQMEAVGWVDGANRPVKDWSKYLLHRWRIEENNRNAPKNAYNGAKNGYGGKTATKPSVWEIKTRLEAINEELRDCPQEIAGITLEEIVGEEKAKRFRKLREEKEKLRDQLKGLESEENSE